MAMFFSGTLDRIAKKVAERISQVIEEEKEI